MVVAVVGHMQRFYDALELQAIDTSHGRMFVGYTTKVFNDLRLPAPYYSRLLAIMREMGCVEQVKRGAKNTKSEWLLKKRPTEEDYALADLEILKDYKIEQTRISQDLLNQRVDKISSQMANLSSQLHQVNQTVNQLTDVVNSEKVREEENGPAAGSDDTRRA